MLKSSGPIFLFHSNSLEPILKLIRPIFFHFFTYFVPSRFFDKRDAEDALDAMDGRMLDGRELRVQMARYGRPPSSGRRGGRDRDRRR